MHVCIKIVALEVTLYAVKFPFHSTLMLQQKRKSIDSERRNPIDQRVETDASRVKDTASTISWLEDLQ